MTVFIPELSEEDNQGQIERVETYISNAGGSVTETLTSSPWGRRRLAYTIRFNGVDYRDGFYTVYHFDSRPGLLTELERDLKLDTNVMRYLLVHDDPKAGEKFPEGAEGEAEGGLTEGAEAAAGAVASAATEATEGTTTEAPATDADATSDTLTPVADTEPTPESQAPATEADQAPEPEAAAAPQEAETSDAPTEETAEAPTEDTAGAAPEGASNDDASTDKE
jgi:ribosomal protein S6